jgi:hypothetical protein
VPLAQNAALSVTGKALLGAPLWTLVGLPTRIVQPIEYGFLLLGLLGSLTMAHELAEQDCPSHWAKAFAPWAVLGIILFGAAAWLIAQPMDMRATFLE